MAFWTRLSKVLFPKKSPKMIDGSEKHKQLLAFDFRVRMFLKNAVSCEKWKRLVDFRDDNGDGDENDDQNENNP